MPLQAPAVLSRSDLTLNAHIDAESCTCLSFWVLKPCGCK